MNLDFSLVPYGVLSTAIPKVIKYLEVSESWTRGRSTTDDILKFLFTGQMQLWVVLDDKEIYGQIITEIKQYPQCKMLVIQYCSGEKNHMKFVEDKVYDTLERYAKDFGCSGIELIGRPGWHKHVVKRGYETRSVMYQKFFE
jgi:hypothetical protein